MSAAFSMVAHSARLESAVRVRGSVLVAPLRDTTGLVGGAELRV